MASDDMHDVTIAKFRWTIDESDGGAVIAPETRRKLRQIGVSEIGITQLQQADLISDPNDRRMLARVVIAAMS